MRNLRFILSFLVCCSLMFSLSACSDDDSGGGDGDGDVSDGTGDTSDGTPDTTDSADGDATDGADSDTTDGADSDTTDGDGDTTDGDGDTTDGDGDTTDGDGDTTDGDGDTTDGDTTDGSDGDTVEPPTCDITGFTAVEEGYFDNQGTVTYQALSSDADPFDALVIEFWPDGNGAYPIDAGPGTYPLASNAIDEDYATCTTCLRVFSGCNESTGCTTGYFAIGGAIEVDAVSLDAGIFEATLVDVQLAEAEFGEGGATTLVAGGDVWCLDGYETTLAAECGTDADCVGNPAGAICDQSSLTCVGCANDLDCDDTAPVCAPDANGDLGCTILSGLCTGDVDDDGFQENDGPSAAIPFGDGVDLSEVFVNGAICSVDASGNGERDWFTFTITADQTISAELAWSETADLDLYLLDADYNFVSAQETASTSGPESIDLSFLPAGTYYLFVNAWDTTAVGGGTQGVIYDLTLLSGSVDCITNADCDPGQTCSSNVCIGGGACDITGFTPLVEEFTPDDGGGFAGYTAQTSLGEPFDQLAIEFFDIGNGLPFTGPGTYALGANAVDQNYATCENCLLIRDECAGGSCDTFYFAISGEIVVTQADDASGLLVGSINNAELVEVTIATDGSFTSTPVPGGQTWCLNGYTIDTAPECTTDGECSAPTPFCDPDLSICLECVDDGDCTGALEVCGPASTCEAVECVGDADCAGNPNGAICDTADNVCVECVSDAQCSGTAVCNANLCEAVECTDDADCAGNPNGDSCDTSANVCVACTNSFDCEAGAAACVEDAAGALSCANVDECDTDDAFEENDGPSAATTLAAGSPLSAMICESTSGNELDWFEFTLNDVANVTLTLTAPTATASDDLDLVLVDAAGTQLASSASSGSEEEIVSAGLAAGTYYAVVLPYGTATPTGPVDYDVSLALETPECSTDADCATSPNGGSCDPDTFVCVVCADDFDCDAANPICADDGTGALDCLPPVTCTGDDAAEQADDGPGGATVLTVNGGGANAAICGDSADPSGLEADWYAFTLAAPGDVTVTLDWVGAEDLDIYLLDASGDGIATSFFGQPESISESLDAGTYYVIVRSYAGDTAAAADYTLSVTSP